jgi:hypothetical protein
MSAFDAAKFRNQISNKFLPKSLRELSDKSTIHTFAKSMRSKTALLCVRQGWWAKICDFFSWILGSVVRFFTSDTKLTVQFLQKHGENSGNYEVFKRASRDMNREACIDVFMAAANKCTFAIAGKNDGEIKGAIRAYLEKTTEGREIFMDGEYFVPTLTMEHFACKALKCSKDDVTVTSPSEAESLKQIQDALEMMYISSSLFKEKVSVSQKSMEENSGIIQSLAAALMGTGCERVRDAAENFIFPIFDRQKEFGIVFSCEKNALVEILMGNVARYVVKKAVEYSKPNLFAMGDWFCDARVSTDMRHPFLSRFALPLDGTKVEDFPADVLEAYSRLSTEIDAAFFGSSERREYEEVNDIAVKFDAAILDGSHANIRTALAKLGQNAAIARKMSENFLEISINAIKDSIRDSILRWGRWDISRLVDGPVFRGLDLPNEDSDSEISEDLLDICIFENAKCKWEKLILRNSKITVGEYGTILDALAETYHGMKDLATNIAERSSSCSPARDPIIDLSKYVVKQVEA